MIRLIRTLYLVVAVCFTVCAYACAQNEERIVVLVSGQAYSHLYPCTCPHNPSGGVLRRATVIKETRAAEKNVLVVEAGGSFAGEKEEGNSRSSEINQQKTDWYLKALAHMGYDAVLISSQEFVFGQDFLKKSMRLYQLPYISSNLKEKVPPYVMREMAGLKIGIIGITDANDLSKPYLTSDQNDALLIATVKEVKTKHKADVVIVLGFFDKETTQKLIDKVKGVNVWISSNTIYQPTMSERVGDATLLFPAWQARALTKIVIRKNKEHVEISAEPVMLDPTIGDDARIAEIIPACFNDGDCRKDGAFGRCQNGGSKEAQCIFTKQNPVKITVIRPMSCKTCTIEETLGKIRRAFPQLVVHTLLSESKEAQQIIASLQLTTLPAYLFDGTFGKEEDFSRISPIVTKKGEYYMVNPQWSGVAYFINRKPIPNRLDVFFDKDSKKIKETLSMLQALAAKRNDIDIHFNFLAVEEPKKGFIAKNGKTEVEEYLRYSCIANKYPDKIWYYLICRLANSDSSWWDDCMLHYGIDIQKIKGCAQTQEGVTLLRQFTALTQELEVVFGPTFLINNQEIVSMKEVPTVEEVEALFQPDKKTTR